MTAQSEYALEQPIKTRVNDGFHCVLPIRASVACRLNSASWASTAVRKTAVARPPDNKPAYCQPTAAV